MKRRNYLAALPAGLALASSGGRVAGVQDHDQADGDGEDPGYPLVETFDDFENLDPWSAFIGSIEADTDRFYEGSQSARLLPANEEQVRIRRELDESIDVSEVVPGIAMTAERSGGVRIQLHDTDGDYVEYSQQVRRDMPLVRKNFGPTRVRGDPDMSEVVLLQIIRWYGDDDDEAEDEDEAAEADDEIDEDDGPNAEAEEVDGAEATDQDEEVEDEEDLQMWVDDFHFVPRPETGTVLLQFHGGYETHYTEGLSILEEYDLPATTFVPTDRVRPDEQATGDRLTIDQLGDLSAAGWTVGSYSRRGLNLTNVDEDELEADVVEPVEWLTEQGYDDGARFFAFPGSQYDQASYELVQDTYDLAFAGRAPSQGYAANPHLCSVVHSPDAEEGVEILDWTAEMGGITSIAFYQLEDEEILESIEAMAAHVDQLETGGELEVIDPATVADQYVL